jgi:hypothetical protein
MEWSYFDDDALERCLICIVGACISIGIGISISISILARGALGMAYFFGVWVG